MPAKPIATNWTAQDATAGASEPAPVAPSQPSVNRRLDLLAAEIAADAQRTPAEVVEWLDTRQQGE